MTATVDVPSVQTRRRDLFSVADRMVTSAASGSHLARLLASVQARYWWGILAGGKPRLVLQGGIGVVLADITDADTGAADSDASFVIPLGIGLDYAVTSRVALTADFILSVTSLGERVSAGGREVDLHTNVISGFFLGVRF